MEVRVEATGDLFVITPAGRLDGPGARKLRQESATLTGAKLPLVIDLGETSAVLALGAETIYSLARQRRANGARTAVARCNPATKRLLHAAGIAAFVAEHATVSEARKALRAASGGA